MSVLTRPPPATPAPGPALIGSAARSPAGAIAADRLAALSAPPRVRWPCPVQVLWFGQRQASFMFRYRGQFGGGTRRCLGAALAMAEQRVVMQAMTGRLDLEAADPRAERPKHRNVTMIPARGGRVIVRARR